MWEVRNGSGRGRALPALLAALSLTLVGEATWAGCCELVKVDTETPPGPVRACEPDTSGQGCGLVLVETTLALGERAPVCSAGATVVYQEADSTTGAWTPPVTAVCDGADVEL